MIIKKLIKPIEISVGLENLHYNITKSHWWTSRLKPYRHLLYSHKLSMWPNMYKAPTVPVTVLNVLHLVYMLFLHAAPVLSSIRIPFLQWSVLPFPFHMLYRQRCFLLVPLHCSFPNQLYPREKSCAMLCPPRCSAFIHKATECYAQPTCWIFSIWN